MTESELTQMEHDLRALATWKDPVPADVIAGARAALSMRSLDAELADLVYDSLLDERSLAGVRGGGSRRQLTFEAPGFVLELEVDPEPYRHLVGQVIPPGPATIEFRHARGITDLPVDNLGRFEVPRLPAGPVSIRCRREHDAAVATAWVTI